MLLLAERFDIAPVTGALTLLASCLALMLWVAVAKRLFQREPVLPLSPRRPVPWAWWLMLGAFLTYLALEITLVNVALIARAVLAGNREAAQVELPRDMWLVLACNSLAGLLTMLLGVSLMRGAAGATSADLGIEPRWIVPDIPLGVAAFLVAAPVVFLIKWLLLPLSPDNHPLEQYVRGHASRQGLFWTFVTAVVAAPLVEEFLLRVVFQGWLERVLFRPQGVPQSVEIIRSSDPTLNPMPLESVSASAANEPTNPYSSPAAVEPAYDGLSPPLHSEPCQIVPAGWRAALPILGSSALFAVMHYGHGIDPIPIFVLALFLGWLYQRTHRLWPCVFMHMSLNAVSVLSMYLASR